MQTRMNADKPDNDAGTQGAEQTLQFVREAVAQENRYPDQQDSNHCGQRADDQLQMCFLMYVAAQREGHGYRSRSDRQRHGERIKSLRQDSFAAGRCLQLAVLLLARAIQNLPAGHGHDQSAAHLDRCQADAEELQNVGADEQRRDQQHHAVDRDPHGHGAANAGVVAQGHFRKDGRHAERVHDGKQRGKNQQHVSYDGVHARPTA